MQAGCCSSLSGIDLLARFSCEVESAQVRQPLGRSHGPSGRLRMFMTRFSVRVWIALRRARACGEWCENRKPERIELVRPHPCVSGCGRIPQKSGSVRHRAVFIRHQV